VTTIQADDLRATLAALPKIDLHRHLEGSLRLRTLAEIARQHGLDLPSSGTGELRPLVQVVDEPPDFSGFLAKFKLLRHFYLTQDVVMRLAYECVADAALDNVRYLELRFSPVALSRRRGFDLAEVTHWVTSAVEHAQRDYNIKVRLIATIGREESSEIARRIAELAVSSQDRGLVGLDLAGDEINYPTLPFADVFQWARARGLHITIHAGEVGPASNIRQAIEEGGAERIGHGVRAGEDPAVIDLLASRKIALEMCPTSNLHTGAVATLNEHPLRQYQAANIPATINTDDPSISNTTLTDEYLAAVQVIGLSYAMLRQAILEAVQAAFLPTPERRQMVEWFQQALPLYHSAIEDWINLRSSTSGTSSGLS
jgi:adenosine deaminase